MTQVSKSWEEYAADQRYASGQELVAIKKILQGILFLLIVLLLVIGIPMLWLLAQ